MGDTVHGAHARRRQGGCHRQRAGGADTGADARSQRAEAGGPHRTKVLSRRPGFPLDRFSRVERIWDGGCIGVVVGSGPSFSVEQRDLIERARAAGACQVVAINDAYLRCPFADVLYFADASWWEWQARGIDKPELGLTAAEVRDRFESFAGEKCTIQQSGGNVTDLRIHMLRNMHFPMNGYGFSTDPEELAGGNNSGHQGFNLIALAGCNPILLVGIDGKPAADGKRHFFGNHPVVEGLNVYPAMVRGFHASSSTVLKLGIRVVNCAPDSAIACYERGNLETELRV